MDYWEQKIASMYRIVFLFCSSFLLIACADKTAPTTELPYYNSADFTPLFISDPLELEAKVTHKIGDFSFLNQDSTLVNQSIVSNKIHIANFIFSSCGSICPLMTRNMKTISDHFIKDDEVVILSYSVTPWLDTPAVLKKYKSDNNITNENWCFLTGSKSEIYKLARQSYFAEEELGFTKDSTEFLHTEHCILIDKNQKIRGIYNGTLPLEMKNLISDIESLKREN